MDLGKCYYSLKEAKKAAYSISTKHPHKYITIFSCFGLYLHTTDKMHVNEPSDSCYKSYWHNGKESPFTKAQIINDQIHTPTMA